MASKKTAAGSKKTAIGGESPTNGAESAIVAGAPYEVEVQIEGSCDILLHRWNCEAVEAKAKAGKNSAIKKTDDLESYVYRNADGDLCLPGEYLRQSVIEAVRYRQDPRSPRKSARDLYKAGLVPLTDLAPFNGGGVDDWDYVDRRRVVVNRGGVTRERPAVRAGWTATFRIMVMTPDLISPGDLNDTIATAGRLVGTGDFRPTFGRYRVIGFRVIDGSERG